MATNLRGVMAALLTPFDQQQALDKASLRRLVQFNIQQGIDGLYVGGSTGEAFVQSLSEREQVLEIVAEEAKGKIKLIAHVGCVSTAESQQLAASAKRYGFDAVSAVTPFYYPFSFEEHCDHYRAIIDSADGLPMVVYNIPALSGVKLTLDQINTLVTLPGVGALKQTSGDLYQMEQIRREHPDLVLYNGYDEIFASGLLAGADGGIGSTYNIMGWRYQGIVKALKEGDILLNGHTHVPACEEKENGAGETYRYLNPGSVSIPKENSPHSYMIYENDTFIWKNLEGEEYMRWKTDSHC